jgi:hypothetical protein
MELPAAALASGGGGVTLAVAVDSRWNRTEDPLWGSGSLWNYGGVGTGGGGGDGYSFGGYGGIVGHARLLLRERAWLEDSVLVTCAHSAAADWACRVQFSLVGSVSAATDTVNISICSWNTPDAPCLTSSVPASAAGTRAEATLTIKDARLWFPGTRAPKANLYTAHVSLTDASGGALDSRETRFGVRSVKADGPRIEFNGEAVFLRGYGDDGNYASTAAPPMDTDFYLAQLRSMKALGYNFIRFHTHAMPEELFDAADELGFLCDPEFAMSYAYPTKWASPVTPAVKRVFNVSFASLVRRLSHHPSIFGWVLSNEIEWPQACLDAQAGHTCNATCGAPCSPPQFVELYRYANEFDPERPCWWSDGVSGLDPGLSCRNGADAADKFCFADVMVSQSGWGHTTAGAAVEHGSGIAEFSTMPVPYIMHESYDARTFPRLLGNLAAYSEGKLFNASVWLATSISQMRRLGLLEENELWSVASEREYTMWLKAFVESFRLDNAVSGYEWWLGFDWLGASNGVIAGHENAWRPKAGIDNETLATVQSEVVLLVRAPITLQSIGVSAGQAVAVEVLLSNWTLGGYPSWNAAAELTWTAQTSGDSKPFAHGSQALASGAVPQGQTQPVANLSVQLPASLAGATKVVLEVSLRIGATTAATNLSAPSRGG